MTYDFYSSLLSSFCGGRFERYLPNCYNVKGTEQADARGMTTRPTNKRYAKGINETGATDIKSTEGNDK
jgi:hypothetical protein